MLANPDLKLSSNVDGEFFVDSTCINCDTCRQLAPENFAEMNGYSYVIQQPSEDNIENCMEAAIACPTGSIGHNRERRDYLSNFPIELDNNLYYLGFHSPKSYGGASYFVTGKTHNWMIDAPRYSTHLVDQIENLGGIDYIFLTHQDDVADAGKYGDKFNAKRIIHYYDRQAEPDSEIIIKGKEEIREYEDIVIIPTPGHTKGHMCLLFDNNYLFTGDHLNWNRDWQGLRASRRMNWFSWEEQIKSIDLLTRYEFSWILPGHGQRVNLDKDTMRAELDKLIVKIHREDYW